MKVRESALRHYFFIWKSSFVASKCCFFGLKMVPGWSGIILKKTSNFQKSSEFWHFLWHISWPEQVFPWSDWAHIKQAPSSNIVLMLCLRISWSVKYFYQKYWVKGSENRTSAGTPRISRRPVQWWRWGRVLRTTSIFDFKIIVFCVEMLFFWSGNGSRSIWDHPQRTVKISKTIKILTFFVTHFLTAPGLPVVRLSSY